MQAHEQAADILLRVLEALARQHKKTLSAATRADVARACELLTKGDDYSDLLEDLLLEPPPRREYKTQSFDRVPTEAEQIDDFDHWRRQRR